MHAPMRGLEDLAPAASADPVEDHVVPQDQRLAIAPVKFLDDGLFSIDQRTDYPERFRDRLADEVEDVI
jgi:hypothetical protein